MQDDSEQSQQNKSADVVKPRRSDAEQKRLLDAITELCEQRITFNGFLGFKLESVDKNAVRLQFPMREELVGHYLYGRLHGGVISSVLDAAGGLAVMWRLAEYHAGETTMEVMSRFRYLGTVDLRIDYLRQGVGETFHADGEVVRLGKRIAATRMSLYNEKDVQIATGNGTYIVS